MSFILSTLTASQDYTFYKENHGNAFNLAVKTIHVNGGANVADKHFVTKDGVMTELSKEDIELLKTHSVFQMHVKNGFVKIIENEKQEEKVKADMEKADAAAPLTPEKYKSKNKKVKVG